MVNKRVVLMSALALGLLSVFLLGSSQAALLNGASFEPSESNRVDAAQAMSFSINFTAEGDDETITEGTFVAVFGDPMGSWSYEVALVCTDNVDDCEGSGDQLNGTWSTPVGLKAEALVEAVGSETIYYGFKVTTSLGSPEVFGVNTNVRVNTLPSLEDNVNVTGDDLPFSTRKVTVNYTDLDGHSGVIIAKVCEVENPSTCESPFPLNYESGVEKTGAVYSAEFTTSFGGSLSISLNASDDHDFALQNRTGSFSVDKDKPWLVNDSVSPTTSSAFSEISFGVVYCVFEVQTNPVASVTVGDKSYSLDIGGDSDEGICVNGVGKNFSTSQAIDWAITAQNVSFSASNDEDAAKTLNSSAVSINDLPFFVQVNRNERVGDDFVFNVTASDPNLNQGDMPLVFLTIEGDEEIEMINDGPDEFGGQYYTLTVSESDIIDQMGGTRTVTFRVVDGWLEEDSDSSQTIEVTKTSNFDFEVKGGGSTDFSTAPGTSAYTFSITNNGNSEDTFNITTSSVNGWLQMNLDPVTVAKDATVDFEITVTVPKVLAGTKDTWTITSSASNDESVEDKIISGSTSADTVTGHTLTGDTDMSGDPGDSVTYHFTILNTGNSQEKMDYTITSSWNIDNVGGSTTLDMGASDRVSVTQTIPADALASDTATLTFSVLNGAGSSSSVTTSAKQVYGVTVSSGTLTGLKPGESGNLAFTVTNTGNGFDTFAIDHSGVWATSKSVSNLALDAGQFGTVQLTVQIPADAASASSSSVGVSASSNAESSDSYDVVVASSTRSLTISGTDTYVINKDTVGTGTAIVQNTGVSSTFIVTSMTDSVSFALSEYTIPAGGTEEISFSIMASASGTQSFTISDNVDFSSFTHSFDLTARTFSTNMSLWGLSECSNSGVTCTYDSASWDGTEYSKAGTWVTSMIFTDENGQIGTHSFDTMIENSDPIVAVPSLDNPVQGTEQFFSFTIPTDADGTVTHFVIDFGDGESQTFQASDFIGQTVTATHTYSKSGNFEVVATAYDNSGGSAAQTVAVSVSDEMLTLEGSSYNYNLVALIGFFLLGAILSGTAFKLRQGEIAGDEEMNERDRQRLESVERRMESLSEREELMEVSAYDASRAATKLEEHISAFNSILVKAQEIAAEDKLKELEAAEKARQKEEEEMQLDLEDPDIEMVAERFHESLARLVAARDDLSKIEKHLARILKMERDEQLEKLTEMTESYESTKRKIDALESSKQARDEAAVENNIMNMLSAAASGGSMADADFGDFGDFGGDDEYEVEIYEDEDGSFYYIDPDTGEEVPCDEDGNAL